MVGRFVDEFTMANKLTQIEEDVLRQSGVRSNEDVDSLVKNFPSIVEAGVRLPVMSNAAAQHLSAAYSSVADRITSEPPSIGLGANPPPGASTTLGNVVGSAPPPPFIPPTGPTPIDLRVLPWPVRDQQRRGTCVAFGATACVEHLRSTTEGSNPDYSEQFLYWAIKDHSGDPAKNRDGTWLQFARDMLQQDGICHEKLCSYIGAIAPPAPVSGPAPSAKAISEAASHMFAAATYRQRPSGAASLVLNCLGNGRPVAVSLPVFKDPAVPNGPINWATPVGWAYGRVLNPPIRSVVDGGHCVCITGFVPDSAEPNGGYFILRNSWGTRWANLAPSLGNSNSPEQGYGEISATYVDTYCWELFQL